MVQGVITQTELLKAAAQDPLDPGVAPTQSPPGVAPEQLILKVTSSYPVSRCRVFNEAEPAVAYVKELYEDSVKTIRKAVWQFAQSESNTVEQPREATYPIAVVEVTVDDIKNFRETAAFGVMRGPGLYAATITRPDIFQEYYVDQLTLIMSRYNVPVLVGLSDTAIPLPFTAKGRQSLVERRAADLLKNKHKTDLHQAFVMPDLNYVDDCVPNGAAPTNMEAGLKPMSLFNALRVDFSLQRLTHYTDTSPEHFQRFVLLTNYQRYIDRFVNWGQDTILRKEGGYSHLIGPGDVVLADRELNATTTIEIISSHAQMPAYHMVRPDNLGITMIDIGVGPSNAKTITDHLAVLRPHCWVMVGHCAGLRMSQNLGDYVLAHAYVREDHVLDNDLPLWVPLPAIAEVQLALQEAVANVCGQDSLKTSLRTGTVVTTDNRDWELSVTEMKKRFKQCRAIGLDMESATIAANGFRFRVPYGTLLCVSDKPIHGDIKLAGMANEFYTQRVGQHLKIGLEAMRLLRENYIHSLQSRKLRGFDDPPMR